ncbi:MAG: methyltransferase domain-containing protein [Cetobacterium sp.]|uniref:methyltransferase domain-containing protein n=1 Tax=unclassified Cetobacterium TaxID=2630983 RepID=UPI0006459E16|nr:MULTISPECIES: methyltransferase domain-containing protein [unclassified Cetobacterium]
MRFNKFLNTYDNYAFVQKEVAQKLIGFLEKDEEFETILEIGCGTGIYSKKLVSHIKYQNIILNDLCDSKNYVSQIEKSKFIIEDMDTFEYKKYSLITSSSVFQWSKNLDQLLDKISIAGDRLLFSIYVDGNLLEIENFFGVGLKYSNHQDILKKLKKNFKFVKYKVENIVLEFTTPLEALKHLKYTGVTGIRKNIEITKIRNFKETKLTYKVAYYNCWN